MWPNTACTRRRAAHIDVRAAGDAMSLDGLSVQEGP
jgi:hypothetical protein